MSRQINSQTFQEYTAIRPFERETGRSRKREDGYELKVVVHAFNNFVDDELVHLTDDRHFSQTNDVTYETVQAVPTTMLPLCSLVSELVLHQFVHICVGRFVAPAAEDSQVGTTGDDGPHVHRDVRINVPKVELPKT